MDRINVINVLYHDESVTLFKGTSDMLIIKEYMSKNNSKFYADIINSENIVTIEMGRRPFGIFFNNFNARVEIYLPVLYGNTVKIRTTDGRIEAHEDFTGSSFQFETIDGNISVNTIVAGMVEFKTKDGDIRCEYINGNVSAETKDGKIELGLVNGAVNAKTSDGGIRCTVTENTGDISLVSKDGNVILDLPRNLMFRFSARTSDGRLSTPFSDKLFSPINDKKLIEGIIGGDNIPENSPGINLRTNDGSITVNWLNQG
jgi:DUF4097 and DUF4098 domain-containing protein YvlB